MSKRYNNNLARLFAPKSAAFIGGSSAELAAKQCVKGGFKGKVWGVNPNRSMMAGQPCFNTVDELPCGPDIIFLAVPSTAAIEVVNKLRIKGAGGVVCYSAGFSELGDSGTKHEEKLIEAAGDMAFVGPNCSGMLNYVKNVALWPFDHGGDAGGSSVKCGPAFITQSGMLGNTVTMNQRNLAFSYIISSGNQGQMGVEDFLGVLVRDPKVSAVGLYIEGLRDVSKFVDIAIEALAAGKPIVAQKVGTSDIGAKLTVTHTGSLSGIDILYSALFRRLGIIRVNSSVTLLETLKLINTAGIPKGNRIAGLTCSGGDSTMLADAGEPLGLVFPESSTNVKNQLTELLPSIATVANPLDYTTPLWGNETELIKTFSAMLSDPYDAAILIQDYPALVGGDSYEPYLADVRAFETVIKRAKIPGIVCSILPENLDGKVRKDVSEKGLAPLQGINDALCAIAGVSKFGMLSNEFKLNPQNLKLLRGPSNFTKDWSLSERHSKLCLAEAGVPIPDGQVVTADIASSIASEIGFPVVLKIESADISHKTELGAVCAGLTDSRMVNDAVLKIQENVLSANKEIIVEEFLVEKMILNPIAEILVGVRNDPQFGLIMVIGSGGIMAELIEDVAHLLLPTSREKIMGAIKSLKIARILEGFRSMAAADMETIVTVINKIADFAEHNIDNVLEVEVNPLVVTSNNAWAVDALIRKFE